MTAYPQARPNQPNYVPNHAKPRPSVGNVLLGFFGELLITAGVLVGLFVVWQVYYTDVIGQREATEHIASFLDTGTPEVGMEVAEKQYGPAPEESTSGQFGILYVPPWGETYQMPIHEGTGPEVIDNGYVGHYTDTQAPGEIGNFALAGHRQSRGKPFRYVEELDEGDPIIVRTKKHFYVYRVAKHRIVQPNQTEVLAPNPYDPQSEASQPILTLTTCHPLWSIKERWIVHAELDYWTKAEDGRPPDLPEGSL